MAAKKLVVKQIRSANRRPKRQLQTLQALGLGRIGREQEHEATPSVLGMVRRVAHLVKLEQ